MTDKYYTDGDKLPDTPNQIVSNYEAQAGSLDALVAKSAENMASIEENLG